MLIYACVQRLLQKSAYRKKLSEKILFILFITYHLNLNKCSFVLFGTTLKLNLIEHTDVGEMCRIFCRGVGVGPANAGPIFTNLVNSQSCITK